MSQERFKAEILPMREKLFFIAKKMLEEEQDAEDAVQEVLLKLWHTSDSLEKYDNVEAFATTVTKNHCLDRLKVKNRTDLLDDTYELYHFSEQVENKTVAFDFILKDGKLKNRNAIRILEINDYPEKIINEAIELSGRLDRISGQIG